ncbi:MAG TPA: lipid-A-disaccharide synthase [Gammaproteobacteria bacterium]|nr:lipid-A-disaccharide synthase [Gammaproteobacteria bacterium]
MTTLMISAAEASGDHHASQLIQNNPSINFIGMGGTLSQQAGLTTLVNSNDLGAVGLAETFQKLYKNIQALNTLKQALKTNKNIQALIVIDCPEFNLRLAKYAHKKLGIKVIYIAPPQIWAWRKHRIHAIKKYIDHVVCLFPFEPKLYHQHNVNYSLAKNPSLIAMEKSPLFTYAPQSKVIALLPGSRSSEIKNHLEIMIQSILGNKKLNQHSILVIESDPCHKEYIQSITQSSPRTRYISRSSCHRIPISFALAASGTVCLELAICQIPFGVIYKTSPITTFLLKPFINVKYFSLPNIIMNKPILTELIKIPPSFQNLAKLIEKLNQESYQKKLITELKDLKKKLNNHDGTMGSILLHWLSKQPSL